MALVVFGLTGGLASGKSSVASHWRSRGLPVIDADQLARDVVAPGTEGLDEIASAFGGDVLTPEGGLDRRRVAERAFADPELRARLEGITHPRIAEAGRRRAAELSRAGEPLACYEAALLIEKARVESFRPLVVVTARVETQIARAVARGMAAEHARARIATQATPDQRRLVADYVIDNDDDLEALRARADEVLQAVCARARVDPQRYGRPA